MQNSQETEIDDSYLSLVTVLNSLDALVYVADMQTHKILFTNVFGKGIWGDIKGKICWQVLQQGQTGPCSFCTNNLLVDQQGEPTGVYVWEFQNTVNNRWYQCRDQAIHWVDGRIVRMEIATDITDRKRMEEDLRAAKQQAELLAHKDELTGLNNRRAFFEQGHRAFKQARRYSHPISIIMLDVDHFKKINDSYGHAVGDRVLQAMSEPLRTLIRDIDIVARMGGEEFSFILPETNLDDAANLAERIRQAIEELQVTANDLVIPITASLGVVCSKVGADTLETLLTMADDALYVAKKKGRNQIKKCY